MNRPLLRNGKGYAMTRVNGRDGEDARELGRVPEEEAVGAGPAEARRKVADDWSSGTEDPAFFIKPADAE